MRSSQDLEISKQVFPITLDIDHPRWQKGLKSCKRPMSIWPRRKKSGIGGNGQAGLGAARATWAFALYTIPAKRHDRVPGNTRLEPATDAATRPGSRR
jgi:magnesium-protoporphyrin IX monomethyl ester (oxidative) cyclase